MGVDARISMFNQKDWNEVLIPAAYDILTRKTVQPWMKSAFKDLRISDWELTKIDNFSENCSIIVDFEAIVAGVYSRQINNPKPRRVSAVKMNRRKCRNETCDINSHCLFYNKASPFQEHYGYYFSSMVERILCPKFNNKFLGRNYTTHAYLDYLEDNVFHNDTKIRELLDRLGSRGFYFGTGVGSGVQGWLHENECLDLAAELWKLNLPAFESTLENLISMEPLAVALPKDLKSDEASDIWQKNTLTYLRAFSELAGNSGKGIVWINH